METLFYILMLLLLAVFASIPIRSQIGKKSVVFKEEARKKKTLFLVTIDGVHDIEPIFKGIDSYHLGVTKLVWDGTSLHIYLRRPGLLIGYKGSTLDNLVNHLKYPIVIHETTL